MVHRKDRELCHQWIRWLVTYFYQAIIWTNSYLLSITPLGITFSDILIEIQIFSFNNMHLNVLFENVSYFVSASIR